MINNHDLVLKLTKEVERLQNVIKYRNLYNIRNLLMTGLIKGGLAVDWAMPFMLTGVIVAQLNTAAGNTPFKIDEDLKKRTYVETIDTSSGIHLKHLSSDISYDDELIEYSTGWIINDSGLYERTVTSYRINDEVDLSDTMSILSMTKEELEDKLVITNIKTIRKNVIDPDDEIYKEDAIIVVNHFDYIDSVAGVKESDRENIIKSILYIIQVLCFSHSIRSIGSLIVKNSFRDSLKRYELRCKIIDKDELENIRRILEVKKSNLEMIINDKSKSNSYYKIRKR